MQRATLTGPNTAAGVVMGTASYMAPEQVRGEAADPRTDIFAFGAVLYEMLSGARAFRRDTAAETMTAVLKDDPAELSDPARPVSPALERIVRRCMEKNPEQRFQSARDLVVCSGRALRKKRGDGGGPRSGRCISPYVASALAGCNPGAGGPLRGDVVRGQASRAHNSHAVRPGHPR